jgi:ABC-type dipeptide/oligopeptide/nickel transport system permease component
LASLGSLSEWRAFHYGFIVLVVAGVLRNQSQYMAMLGLAVFAILLVNLVGLTLGVVALSDKDARKRRTTIGVSLNSIAIVCFVLLLIIGLTVK